MIFTHEGQHMQIEIFAKFKLETKHLEYNNFLLCVMPKWHEGQVPLSIFCSFPIITSWSDIYASKH